jgi:transcriptional regulator with XRE-family HTH domain
MTSQMQETFGQYLKKLRIQKGFTLTQLAAELNMDSANLSKVKNGKREFDLKRLPLFCSIFQLDTKEMEIELISEQFAKSVCEKNIDNTIFELAQKKASVFSQKLYQNRTRFVRPKLGNPHPKPLTCISPIRDGMKEILQKKSLEL